MKNKHWLNFIFLAVCIGIVSFLLAAPDKTTSLLPHDENHNRFFEMDKKVAEQYCLDCHSQKAIKPLPLDHPGADRCLLCHTKD